MRAKTILATIISLAFLSPIAAFAHAPEYHTEGAIEAAQRGTFAYGDDGTPSTPVPAAPQSPPSVAPSLSAPAPGSRY